MLHYLVEWGHIYLMHVAALSGALILDKARAKELPLPSLDLVIGPFVWASMIAILSSHAHAHYLSHFVK